ncbi:unnamed protein product, partial [Ectocarpus fasciculatus]
SPAAILNFAGHVPGVGSRSSTRCSPLDFLEAPTVVTPKSQTAGVGSSSSSSRESAAVAAAEGLAVLAAAGEAATAAAEAAVSTGRRRGEEEGTDSRRLGLAGGPPSVASGESPSAVAGKDGSSEAGPAEAKGSGDGAGSKGGAGAMRASEAGVISPTVGEASSSAAGVANGDGSSGTSRKENGSPQPPADEQKGANDGKCAEGAAAQQAAESSVPATAGGATSSDTLPSTMPQVAATGATDVGTNGSSGASSGAAQVADDVGGAAAIDNLKHSRIGDAKATTAGQNAAEAVGPEGVEAVLTASEGGGVTPSGTGEETKQATADATATAAAAPSVVAGQEGAPLVPEAGGSSGAAATGSDDVEMTDVVTPGSPSKSPKIEDGGAGASSPDVAMSEAARLSAVQGTKNPAAAFSAAAAEGEHTPKQEADAAGEEEGTPESPPAAAATTAKNARVVAPRGLVRRDGNNGAPCKMCKSKWDRDQTLVCSTCLMHYHPGCLDPPMTPREIASHAHSKEEWRCDYCQTCQGCGKGNEDEMRRGGDPLVCHERGKVHHVHLDAPEGSDPGPRAQEKMWLCSPCLDKYKERNYCPKCGKTYDEHDNMVKAVGCAACEFWVHASCEGLSTAEYQMLVDGKDSWFGGDYLCPVCRNRAMAHMLGELQRADVVGMFAQPVTTAIAANYFLIVKEPMDLKTMRHKVHTGQYNTLQEMRNDCELMSKNALLFNRAPGEYHNRARDYFKITQIAWDSLQAQPANMSTTAA